MLQKVCRWLLYQRLGWKKNVDQTHPEKYILCLAPHTSNWDLIIGQLYAHAEGIKAHFLMKKEWFFWPLGILFRSLGGIPVHREKHTHMTDSLAKLALNEPHFVLCITPEGTRSLNPDWKKGFYYIASEAHLPILLYGCDYQHKLIQCTETVYPSGDIDADMRRIKLYFRDFKGKKPEKFTIGKL
ncbi:MAG: 1-acyl-sn-glycerol-3-phosphate acyltransferase [Prevotella sp.]|jgi:1-acyl-sn-glycerol-3-phosphate acyltransferase|uniref:1-acyl-sn-glycerol-3-phosphate acyltransferase n=1 Tax=Segatella cerevisiae TaxID=2053716 RepID=A0ABT1BW25_9BACT|nr:1-acyl-sn-glycerol-3-phosphate acyltransferase [Segatella cerevisiae]MCH3993667.1 1-acyl-sn-glycerol-3-phosphate acyltransferase [Prevotella sp.]MCI1245918.1 1-acyl-sn-glycerol-3-phosphate acyltransferase [Prevotella sp.]MCO6024632.1 1-acyl-sn-glycerol-3-phosphate acyltransferase [Segatella cerevisiae]